MSTSKNISDIIGEKILRCIHCHDMLEYSKPPRLDVDKKVIFTCKNCGASSVSVLDLTVSGKPETTSIQLPIIAPTEAEIKKPLSDELFGCFEGISFPNITAFMTEDKEPVFKVGRMAQWIYDSFAFKTDIGTDILYFYDGKRWVANAQPYLKKIVSSCLRDDTKKHIYGDIEFCIQPLSYEQLKFSIYLGCGNGLLNVETNEFKPFSPDEMTLYNIPTEYNPTAKCPKFLEFVAQVVAPEDIQLLQEWSGYLLLQRYSLHKMLWILGAGRNGKGVWMRTMRGILGADCTANIELKEFDGEHDFALSSLYGKLANFCSEPLATTELETTILKHATGQDEIDARMMYTQKRLKYTNVAKLTVMGNKFPKCTDQSDGWLERILFLRFPNQFLGESQILDLEQTWLSDKEECSGILNWMLEGLQRLLLRGYFLTGKEQEEALNEYLRNSDTIGAFLKECGLRNNANMITRPETVYAYNQFCDHYGLTAESANKLSARLKDTAFIKDTAVRINGTLERVWKGITFKVIKEAEPVELTLQNEVVAKSVTDVTLVTDFGTRTKNGKVEIKEVLNPVTTVTSVTNPSNTVSNRVCGVDCGHYDKPKCPYKTNNLSKDTPLPLKCIGYTNPFPTNDTEGEF